MWNWLREKLGINDCLVEIANLRMESAQALRLADECLEAVQHGQLGEADGRRLHALEERLNRQLNDINHNIKTIPKEITIKNVLSI